jgi:hypothetical protein
MFTCNIYKKKKNKIKHRKINISSILAKLTLLKIKKKKKKTLKNGKFKHR